ncbi:MAG: PadR family transcriptional regulator [Novosphingobium sp.]
MRGHPDGGELGGGRGAGLFGGRGRGGHGGHGPEGRGGRRGKRFAGDELRLMVLGLLEGNPQHGYQLLRSFAAASGDAYSPSPGMLYPLLTMLAEMGLVEKLAGEGAGSRRSFGLTESGVAELEVNRARLGELMGRLSTIAAEADRSESGPVRRAMINLRNATVERLRSDSANEELPFALAAILDEAAQKIERLK